MTCDCNGLVYHTRHRLQGGRLSRVSLLRCNDGGSGFNWRVPASWRPIAQGPRLHSITNTTKAHACVVATVQPAASGQHPGPSPRCNHTLRPIGRAPGSHPWFAGPWFRGTEARGLGLGWGIGKTQSSPIARVNTPQTPARPIPIFELRTISPSHPGPFRISQGPSSQAQKRSRLRFCSQSKTAARCRIALLPGPWPDHEA
jgi:hypothetical protein